jgi:hypothetical protein
MEKGLFVMMGRVKVYLYTWFMAFSNSIISIKWNKFNFLPRRKSTGN